jgi:hypothetical protein
MLTARCVASAAYQSIQPGLAQQQFFGWQFLLLARRRARNPGHLKHFVRHKSGRQRRAGGLTDLPLHETWMRHY